MQKGGHKREKVKKSALTLQCTNHGSAVLPGNCPWRRKDAKAEANNPHMLVVLHKGFQGQGHSFELRD